MRLQKHKVLFISSWFPNKEQPTLGNFVEKHLHAVSAFCNCSLLHIAFSDSVRDKRFQFDYQEVHQIPYLIVYISRKNLDFPLIGSILKLWFYIKAYISGYRRLEQKNGKPDVLHANVFDRLSFIALIFSKSFNIPFLFTEHWTAYMPDDPNKIGFFKSLLIKMAAKKAKKITVVSTDLQQAMLAMKINGDYAVIPNVVDAVFYTQQRAIPAAKTRFIHISSLDDSQKNISGIIRVLHKLSGIRTDFEFVVIGDGNAAGYKQLSAKMGVYPDYIRFEGQKTSSEIAAFMQAADCLLMFSNYESFSVVIAEALAGGLPVIATKSGGLANELSEDYGIIIPAGDESALLDAMITMMDNYKNYDSEKIRNYALQFSAENIGKAFSEIYDKILNQNGDK
jgi:L-malate glycosyltransferase